MNAFAEQLQATKLAEAALEHLLVLLEQESFTPDLTGIGQVAERLAERARCATATRFNSAPLTEPASGSNLAQRLLELQARGLGARAESTDGDGTLQPAVALPGVSTELIDAMRATADRLASLAEQSIDEPVSGDGLGDCAWVTGRGIAGADLLRLAHAYRSVGISLVELDGASGANLADALQRAATSQSALRSLLSAAPYWHGCPLQAQAFEQVRVFAKHYRIYVPRHLRANDPADPRELYRDPRTRSARGFGVALTRASHHDPADAKGNSDLLCAARQRIAGKHLLLIGGDEREHIRSNLEVGLQLGSLRWLRTAHHGAHAPLRQAIASDAVDAVALAIRWSSHSFSGLADVARQYGKPLIRLPAGLGLHQIAHQIVAQVPVH